MGRRGIINKLKYFIYLFLECHIQTKINIMNLYFLFTKNPTDFFFINFFNE